MQWIPFVLLVLLQPTSYPSTESSAVFRKIPKQITNWKASAKDEIFDRETIFKHINGGAELYLAYGFQKALVRRYANDSGTEILLDVYDMGSAADAFGVFSSEYDRGDAGIGQGSEYADGLLRFWKDRYFVSVYAMGEEKNLVTAVKRLGRMVAAAIRTRGKKPDLLNHLSPKDLHENKIRYFHTDLILQKYLYIADENILELSPYTDCLLVEHKDKPNHLSHILLIRYPDKNESQHAMKRFLNHIAPDMNVTEPVYNESLGWSWAQLDHNLLKIVLNASSKQQASEMLASFKPAAR